MTRSLSAFARPCVFTTVWEEINFRSGRQRGLIIWLCFITAWLFIGFRDVQINVYKIKFLLSNVFFFPFLPFFLLSFPPSIFSFTIRSSILFSYVSLSLYSLSILFSSRTFLYHFIPYFARFFIPLFLIYSLLFSHVSISLYSLSRTFLYPFIPYLFSSLLLRFCITLFLISHVSLSLYSLSILFSYSSLYFNFLIYSVIEHFFILLFCIYSFLVHFFISLFPYLLSSRTFHIS